MNLHPVIEKLVAIVMHLKILLKFVLQYYLNDAMKVKKNIYRSELQTRWQ